MDQLVGRCAELLPHRNEPVVVVSGRGFRSRLAARQLEIAGFTDVSSLDGGMACWLDLGLPVERASSPPNRLDQGAR
jgi:rhodanese-related sulfurtransferase